MFEEHSLVTPKKYQFDKMEWKSYASWNHHMIWSLNLPKYRQVSEAYKIARFIFLPGHLPGAKPFLFWHETVVIIRKDLITNLWNQKSHLVYFRNWISFLNSDSTYVYIKTLLMATKFVTFKTSFLFFAGRLLDLTLQRYKFQVQFYFFLHYSWPCVQCVTYRNSVKMSIKFLSLVMLFKSSTNKSSI